MDIEKTIEKIIENQDPKTIIIILLIIVLVVYNLYKLYNHYFYIDNLLSDIKSFLILKLIMTITRSATWFIDA